MDLHRVMIMDQARLVRISSDVHDIAFEVAEQLELVLMCLRQQW